MSDNEWEIWLQDKTRQHDIQKWGSQFQKAQGKRKEWQKVYRAYLRSDIWKQIRNRILKRSAGKCEDCGKIILDPDVHHINYDRVGGRETDDDLKVLCFSCHQKADIARARGTDKRRKDGLYWARLNGFASRKYGDDWYYHYDEANVEIEFISYLYKQYCQELGLTFRPDFDLSTDAEFLEFWGMVLDGHW